jgi:hypothetical protein
VVDDNTTIVDDNTTTVVDNNTTVVDDNTTIVDENSTIVIEDPLFDPDGAEVDLDACRSSYATAVPLQDSNEQNDREASDDANGLAIMSLYTETGNIEDSNIIVYYKTITNKSGLREQAYRKNLYGDNARFRIEYDIVWVSEPNNVLYVEVPKLTAELKRCFKVTIDSEDGSSIIPTKVYR